MADSRKPVQRGVAPEVPAPVDAPTHEWELARLRAHEEITLRWAPLIGAVSAQLMHILIDHTEGKRSAKMSQQEMGRMCGKSKDHIGRLLAALEKQWNLIKRRKRQGVSEYVISDRLLPDFSQDLLPARCGTGMGASPLFGGAAALRPGIHADSESDNNSDPASMPTLRPGTHADSESEKFARPGIYAGSDPASMPTLNRAHKEDARAPARGVVVVSNYENSGNTTTTTHDELLPLQQRLQALSPSLRYSRSAATRIFQACRERAPTASVEELSGAIVAMAESCSGAPNPIGTITNWSRNDFSLADVENWREENRQREAKRERKQDGPQNRSGEIGREITMSCSLPPVIGKLKPKHESKRKRRKRRIESFG